MLNLSHKKLEVWKLSKTLIKQIYQLTDKFPIEEKFNIISQMRRAVVSVSSNIAEGMSRNSVQEKRRFLEISRSSLIELDTQIEVCFELNYIKEVDSQDIHETLNHIFAMLTNLIAKIK
ncbi:MAG: four helix bundle protein [Melioribacteraceae bacterium]